MKQLVYRNILGSNPRKREVSIEEISNRAKSKMSRRLTSKYFIKERHETKCLEDLKRWIKINRKSDCPRNCHIITMIDSRTREYKIICKVLGVFYVIWGLTVYKIVYSNQIKIQMAHEK